LQVANPQNEFRDGSGAGINFQAEKLMRVNGLPFQFQFERVTKLRGHVEHFASNTFRCCKET